MAFVKLDCGILNSTLWVDKDARDIFITALLMAEPEELDKPTPQLEVRSLDETGFVVPPGWYGFVPAAGTGIIRRAGMEQEQGMAALERCGAPDTESRTPDFEGRRLVRVDGGYIILNYDKYRQKDHTAAERQARHRARKAARNGVTSVSNAVTTRNVTQAEAEAEAEVPKEQLVLTGTTVPPLPPKGGNGRGITEGQESKNLPTTEQSKRFARIFHRRLTTPWQPNEVRVYRKLGTIPEEDLAIVEKYYADNWPPDRDTNILRHDLITFLRHFQGEVGRAYAAQEPKRDTRRAREIETVHTADTLPRL